MTNFLETYDPNWQERHKKIYEQLEAENAKPFDARSQEKAEQLLPAAITGRSYMKEMFTYVELKWNKNEKTFHSPNFIHPEKVPEVIREAEAVHLLENAGRPARLRNMEHKFRPQNE